MQTTVWSAGIVGGRANGTARRSERMSVARSAVGLPLGDSVVVHGVTASGLGVRPLLTMWQLARH
ncbi:MAG: hypothetical protein FJW27_16205 [Acidimicrobiia bacterium]|nr:hypothetical protein [Acidimicrobiia bacterium]